MNKRLLWWGRFDPDYSRNRILRALLSRCGFQLSDFIPRVSSLGSIEAFFRKPPVPDGVWVPAFRHRDFHSAYRFAAAHHLPLIFDPLISSWDKVIFERGKFLPSDQKSIKLLQREQAIFSKADVILADTSLHASFYVETLTADPEKTFVVPVGAEEPLFHPSPSPQNKPIEVLFFGSFINLQGVNCIVEAARLVPTVRWTMLGTGSLLEQCQNAAQNIPHLSFEPWIPYERLPERIGRADILLGIFGDSPKAGRVIPNKVYQSLACGRVVVTRHSDAYPAALSSDTERGIVFVPPDDPVSLAETVSRLSAQPASLSSRGEHAYQIYLKYFSNSQLEKALEQALSPLFSPQL